MNKNEEKKGGWTPPVLEDAPEGAKVVHDDTMENEMYKKNDPLPEGNKEQGGDE
jgi:hypothetical protein